MTEGIMDCMHFRSLKFFWDSIKIANQIKESPLFSWTFSCDAISFDDHKCTIHDIRDSVGRYKIFCKWWLYKSCNAIIVYENLKPQLCGLITLCSQYKKMMFSAIENIKFIKANKKDAITTNKMIIWCTKCNKYCFCNNIVKEKYVQYWYCLRFIVILPNPIK